MPRPSRSSSRASLEERLGRLGTSRVPGAVGAVLVVLGTAALVAAMVPVGPDWLGVTGSLVVATTYTSALAARTGGRPFVFGALALLCGLVAVLSDQDLLLTGAAVSTSALAAVLGVMITVPATGFLASVRECVVALVCAGIGALATVGFEPAIQKERFEYVGLGLALLGALVLVYRLGAGLHGLGRRGLAMVAVGGVVLMATLLYAEALRRYGSTGLVDESAVVGALEPGHPGCLPAPGRDRARRPRPGLRRAHARPSPAGLVGVRLRRGRDLFHRNRARQPRGEPHRGHPVGGLRPGRGPGPRLAPHPAGPGAHRQPRAAQSGGGAGGRRTARTGSVRAPAVRPAVSGTPR
nr:hypothetical protein [Nocardioides convexus]